MRSLVPSCIARVNLIQNQTKCVEVTCSYRKSTGGWVDSKQGWRGHKRGRRWVSVISEKNLKKWNEQLSCLKIFVESSSGSIHRRVQGGYHFVHAISSLIEIEQPGTKQTTRKQVAITESLQQVREQIQPTDDRVRVKGNRVVNFRDPCGCHALSFSKNLPCGVIS